MIVHKQIQLRVHVAPQIESVVLDPLRFKQIVYNLLSNALKFTGEGGSIGIEIAPHGPHEIEVKVEDTGIGIAPEDLPRLFREFEQLEAGPGRTYQGSGLGLSLTKKLVEMQQGSIRVRSVVGRGSTFTVVLPTTLRAGVKRVSRRAQEPAS
jgi:signal transduction histidine kinase